jgi:hypothetical protein
LKADVPKTVKGKEANADQLKKLEGQVAELQDNKTKAAVADAGLNKEDVTLLKTKNKK